ncbi:MAG: HYR domain-containing protein [Acidobacteria bacterium]|nr:HYR domain-containing protein [Acidobacteriota bacterium]MYJ05179.1 HYR domain-containing protein [Acidobacteriota bacterium]
MSLTPLWRRRLAPYPARRSVAILSLLLAGAGCAETTTQPTAPTSFPPDRVQSLALVCPVSPPVESPDGGPARVTFDPPTIVGGLAPVDVNCTPPSGSGFPLGRHAVTCEGRDQLGLTASCSLEVTVFRRLEVTRILAFGDSLTYGAGVTPTTAYPAVLETLLRSRYLTQEITVANEGLPGDNAVGARPRFEAALGRHDPHVVLIMQGTIDVDREQGMAAADAIRRMALAAREGGRDPIIATIPPQGSRHTSAARVEPYNQQIRQIAAVNRVPLVDVHRIIRDGRCSDAPMGRSPDSFPCLAADELHLTQEGYALVARGFFEELKALYELDAADGQPRLSRDPR